MSQQKYYSSFTTNIKFVASDEESVASDEECIASDEEFVALDVESDATDVESDATYVESVATDVESVGIHQTSLAIFVFLVVVSVVLVLVLVALVVVLVELVVGGGGPSVTTGGRSVRRYSIGLQTDSPFVPTDGLSIRHDSVKDISIDKFRVAMPMNSPNAVFGELVLKCQYGKPFDELRSIIKNENIDGLFKKSCFAYFLKLFEDHTLRFPISMVYGLLKRRIKYVGDDKDSKEGEKNMDEVWINYCDMPICFGLKEFAIVTGLRCDRPEEPLIKETPHKGSNKCKAWACEAIPLLRKQFKDYLNKKDIKTDVPSVAIDGSSVVTDYLSTATGATDGCFFWGVAGGVICGGDNHPDTAAASSHDYEHVGAQQKKILLKASLAQGPLKKVNIFATLGKEKKKEPQKIMNDRTKVKREYTMNSFATKDFTNMTNMHVWYEDNSKLIDHLSAEVLTKES
ncbi:putative glycerol-3-phosphate 2-O-acyltransferase 6-like [Capsicum annuum]|nr:putative glycerol-3-phosphate 2-O-acyltransferase 6-like [Capsicum annuum]